MRHNKHSFSLRCGSDAGRKCQSSEHASLKREMHIGFVEKKRDMCKILILLMNKLYARRSITGCPLFDGWRHGPMKIGAVHGLSDQRLRLCRGDRLVGGLTVAAHALKDGDCDQVHSNDEIGRLARTFNVMIDLHQNGSSGKSEPSP
jgi:hypothetical protein